MLKSIFAGNVSDGRIVSFDKVTLCESGMRYTVEYEIVTKDGIAEVSLYSIRYAEKEDRRIPERRAECSIDTVLKLLNDCRLLSWDGFSGAHPKGVRDGIMFRLKAIVNDGKKIYADGSENFPKHYRDFTEGLYNILHKENTE